MRRVLITIGVSCRATGRVVGGKPDALQSAAMRFFDEPLDFQVA